jgi:hypothetical protein
MNKQLLSIYIGLFILSCFAYVSKLNVFIDNKNIYWDSKYILVLLGGILITYSLYRKNKFNDNYILPLLFFLNIGVLLLIYINNDRSPNNIHKVSIIGIIYLLVIFNYKDFKINKGILVNPNKSWIYQYVIILLLWYVSASNLIMPDKSKVCNIILILYPLLFPLDEFCIHRIYSLLFACSINMYYFNSLQ